MRLQLLCLLVSLILLPICLRAQSPPVDLSKVAPGQRLRVTTVDAEGNSASMETTAAEFAAKWQQSNPNMAIPGGPAFTGGEADADITAKGAPPASAKWGLVALGILCLIGAVYFVIRGVSGSMLPTTAFRGAGICACAGAGFIVAAFVPLWAWLALGAVAAVAVLAHFYAEHSAASGDKDSKGLSAALNAAQQLPGDAKALYDRLLHWHASDPAAAAAIKRTLTRESPVALSPSVPTVTAGSPSAI